MKLLATFLFAFAFNMAHADDTIFCLAAQVNPDGTIKAVSGNPAQLIVFKADAVNAYTLKDKFSLFNTKYNIKTPFDMSLVNPMGGAGKSVTNGSVMTAKWNMTDDGKHRDSADLTVDSAKLTGSIGVDSFDGGNWSGSTSDTLACSKAGLR